MLAGVDEDRTWQRHRAQLLSVDADDCACAIAADVYPAHFLRQLADLLARLGLVLWAGIRGLVEKELKPAQGIRVPLEPAKRLPLAEEKLRAGKTFVRLLELV